MNYTKILLAGIAATAAMTFFILMLHFLNLPPMSIGTLLGTATGGHMVLGWIIHFAIGIMFAFIYVLLFNHWLPIENNVARGAIYSLIIFIFSMFVMQLISLAGRLQWQVKEDIALSILANIIGYLVYGCVLGTFFSKKAYTPIHSIDGP